MSARYPNLTRTIFEEIELKFDELKEEELKKESLINFFPDNYSSCKDLYLKREWQKLIHDVTKIKLIPDISLSELGQDTFNMIRSFCFIGDVGYDPSDFTKNNKI